MEEARRPGADGVGDDRPQLAADVVELLEQGQGPADQAAAARDPGGRDQREPADPRGLCECELGGHQPAERVADEVDRAEPGRVQQRSEPCRQLTRTHAAEPRQLDEMEAKPLGQRLDQPIPPAPGAGEAVHDGHVRPGPRHTVVRGPPAELDLLELHPLILPRIERSG